MIATILLAGLLGTGTVETYRAQCDYWADATSTTYTGPCTITTSSDAQGNYVETVKFRNVVIRLAQTNRQGQWATFTINGKPGFRYEANRTEYHYSTAALDMNLNIQH